MNSTFPTDAELWQLVKADDTTAFTALYERYWEEMFSMAFRRLDDEGLAKDIVQDILVHAWENRHTIVVEETLAPYLFTALKYSIVRQIYKAAKKGMVTLPLSLPDLPDDEQLYKEDWEAYELLREKVSQEIALMPERMREIFMLNRDQQLSVRDIALRLSLSEQTVKNQLHTALKRLRSRLRGNALFLPFIL